MLILSLHCKFIVTFIDIVVWVPDTSLLDVEYSGSEKADQILKSVEDFAPEQWGLPPYDS